MTRTYTDAPTCAVHAGSYACTLVAGHSGLHRARWWDTATGRYVTGTFTHAYSYVYREES